MTTGALACSASYVNNAIKVYHLKCLTKQQQFKVSIVVQTRQIKQAHSSLVSWMVTVPSDQNHQPLATVCIGLGQMVTRLKELNINFTIMCTVFVH